jgi:hypothetical protein
MSLCDGCRHVFWYERASGRRTYHCQYAHRGTGVIPGDITACSSFDAKARA